MKKATLITTGIQVYIREDKTAKHHWNEGLVVVSKKETGNAIFCVSVDDLKFN